MAFKRVLSAKAIKMAALIVSLLNINLPAWSDATPSLEDLIKGTAPPPPIEPPDKSTEPTMKIAPLEGEVNAQDVAPAPSTLPLKTLAPLPTPVLPKKPLEGTVQTRQLNSSADENDDNLKGMSPSTDNQRNLNGNAQDLNGLASQDPDMDDQEVMVEWDKWHNRVLNAIQQGLMEQLQSTGDNVMFYDPRTGRMRSKYPLGTMAMFSCQVTPDHHILNLKIEEPSGYPDYDRAVFQAVKVLEGSSILRYPKHSHRKVVFEAAGIRTSMQAGPANFHWGDTEHYRVPGSSN